MKASNRWYVITGGPSTGKTSLLAELNRLGHHTIPEAARTVIDQAIARGLTVQQLRADEKSFQEEVTRLKEQTEAHHDPKTSTFFDRGMHDTLAYLRHYGFTVEQWVKELAQNSRYQKVFLLEPLPTYEQDYARTENSDFVTNVHQLLHDTYAEYDMVPVPVRAASLQERVGIILDHINREQDV